MIHDLDETLKQLLIQKVPIDPTAIDIMFERPNTDWENQLGNKPAINCFLYDIRENLEFRDPERYITRNGTNGTQTRDPVRMDLTYEITVWAKDVDIEHRLLGRVMKALVNYPVLPQEVLEGEMRDQSRPIRAWFALPQDTPKTWDFWGANEWRLKAGFSYRITVAVEPTPVEVDLVTEKIIKMELLNQQES
jgi:hypothetical protein